MQSKINFILQHADNALILGHRNSEWCGHGPILEQDIAISNISLDLIGQARNFYQYAAGLKNDGSTEDSFAYYRDADEFKNILLVEQPNGDWAHTILRQFFFSAYQQLFFEKLAAGKDAQVAAIATKSLKEIAYHLRWSSEWVIRLGDGTEESHARMKKAIDSLWEYTGEMFIPATYELSMVDEEFTPGVPALLPAWLNKVKEVFDEATLPVPQSSISKQGGKDGRHTGHLTAILNELQSVARTYPGLTW